MAFFPEHWQPAADGLANKLGIQKHAQRLCQKHLQPRYQRTVLPLIRSGFCFWISYLSKPTARLSLRGSSLNTTLFVTPPLHLRQRGSNININSLVLFPLLATQNNFVYCLPESTYSVKSLTSFGRQDTFAGAVWSPNVQHCKYDLRLFQCLGAASRGGWGGEWLEGNENAAETSRIRASLSSLDSS